MKNSSMTTYYKKSLHQFLPYIFSAAFLGLISFSFYFLTNVVSNVIVSMIAPDLYAVQHFQWSSPIATDGRGVFSILYLYLLCMAAVCLLYGAIGLLLTYIFRNKHNKISRLIDDKYANPLKMILIGIACLAAIGFYIWVGIGIAQDKGYGLEQPHMALVITAQVLINYCIGLAIIVMAIGLLNWIITENRFSPKLSAIKRDMRIRRKAEIILSKGKGMK